VSRWINPDFSTAGMVISPNKKVGFRPLIAFNAYLSIKPQNAARRSGR
jgi:hypothetical protein